MAVIGNAPFQGLVSGGNIIDASIEGVDLSTSAIAARLGYTPVDPGAATFTANPTISSGTANGVAYLNGSKVLTTGSALVFDGTNLSNSGYYIGTAAVGRLAKSNTTGRNLITGGITGGTTDGAYIITEGYDYGGVATGGAINLVTAGASSPITFLINGTEQMRLTSTGLGIGTSSPSVKLDVAGNATIQNGVLTIGKDTVYDAFINTPESMYFNVDSDGNSTGNRFVWGTDRTGTSGGTEWMRLDSSGNLVIGNSTAWSRLHVTKTVNNTNTAATNITDYQNATFILHNQDEVGTGNKAGMFFAFAGSPGILAGMDGYKVNGTWETGLRWYTNSQTGINTGNIFERMRLDQNGNLGIGNTSPSWKLDVAGAQESLASFRSSITTGAGYARFINGGGTFYIGIESSNGTRISNSGLAYAASMTTEGSTALTFGTNNTNRMTISSTGNIGIATTATYNGAKLSVAGSAEIRGDIRGYYASRAGLASGASVTLWSVPNGYWGTEVSMTLYVSQRDDNIGALSNATYNITAFASGGVVITSQGASTYGASKPFTLTASSGSGGMSVSFTNNAGAASTGITMVANVLVGYGAIAWGF